MSDTISGDGSRVAKQPVTKDEWIAYAQHQLKRVERAHAELHTRNSEKNAAEDRAKAMEDELQHYRRRRDTLLGFLESTRQDRVAETVESRVMPEGNRYLGNYQGPEMTITAVERSYFDKFLEDMAKDYGH